MRIISGIKRGLKLNPPKSLDTRPTEDRVKENMFNLLGNLRDLKVLDAFAGTGALGLEALSRGASFVLFCENNHKTLTTLKDNIEKVNLKSYTMYSGDVYTALNKTKEKFDLVFLDPPYQDLEAYGKVLKHLVDLDLLNPGARIVCERNHEINLPQGFDCLKSRKYGSKWVDIVKWSKR